MTLPDERTRSLLNVREFLIALASPHGGLKRIPSDVRRQARYLLKHYPTTWDLDRLAERCPELLYKVKP